MLDSGDPRILLPSLTPITHYYHVHFLLPRGLSALNAEPSEKLASRRTTQRLSLISRHLDQHLPLPDLNTPFSTERGSHPPDDIEYKPLDRTLPSTSPSQQPESPSTKMSSQAPHPTLLIPGPIEFDDAVLQSMAHYA